MLHPDRQFRDILPLNEIKELRSSEKMKKFPDIELDELVILTHDEVTEIYEELDKPYPDITLVRQLYRKYKIPENGQFYKLAEGEPRDSTTVDTVWEKLANVELRYQIRSLSPLFTNNDEYISFVKNLGEFRGDYDDQTKLYSAYFYLYLNEDKQKVSSQSTTKVNAIQAFNESRQKVTGQGTTKVKAVQALFEVIKEFLKKEQLNDNEV